ncbi:MAG TPA: RNA polymerase factor sigma-54 [Saprospiraceae bacterium]|nr:RNA polymerase factor sigma-54 [Saprospiraceae bacterium]
MIRQTLTQKQLQRLSPRQIQLMKLIQIPAATLDQRVQEELEANPALEESRDTEYQDSDQDEGNETSDEFEMDDYLQEYIEDDPATYKMRSNNYSADREEKKMPSVVETSFQEYLLSQVSMLSLKTEEEHIIAEQIVGSIDQDGYLRRDTRALVDDLMLNQNLFVDESKVDEILRKIQKLDPPGIGARNLQECLLLQLKRKLNSNKNIEQYDELLLAKEMIENYFDQFSKKHYNKLMKYMDLTEQELKGIIDRIIRLNPKPASGYAMDKSSNKTNYIVSDFFVKNNDGELTLELNNQNAPELRINDQYKEMLINFKEHKKANSLNDKDKEAILFIKNKIDSAKWFIDAIRQRQNTLYRTMYTIMQYQKEFFLTGDRAQLKPMILKDIADVTGLDISTISRVANSKYVQTEFGTIHLKDFFSESIVKDDGEVVSTNEVKSILQDIIDEENKSKPLSDENLKKLLDEQGYKIARRTVAKYREQLGIPVARLRKVLMFQ